MPLPVTDFIVQRIKEHDSTINITSGTGFYELMVAPLSVILQPLRDEVDTLKASQTILQVLETATPNSFDQSTVDYLLSNLRVDRKSGAKASTTIRMKFFSTQELVATAGSLSFQNDTGFVFKNTLAVNISQAQMSTQFDGEIYYVDILCTAANAGAGFNLAANTVTIMQNEPAGVSSVTNPYAVTSGVSSETNTQFIERAKTSISVRTLVTAAGISSMLTENFESIREASAAGFKDPEMMRDIISNVHVGGYVDAWMKPDSMSESVFSSTTGLALDTARTVDASELLTMPVGDPLLGTDPLSIVVPLAHQNLVGTPTVRSLGGSVLYSTPGDYTITPAGTFTRPQLSTITYLEALNSNGSIIEGSNSFVDASGINFVAIGVVSGDSLVLNQTRYPGGNYSTADGIYTVATVAADTLTLNEPFPAGSATALTGATIVGYAIYGRVRVDYKYNPLSIDFKATPTAGRELHTITDVPLLRIEKVEEVDPVTYELTGVEYEQGGGWGAAGFGSGPWGIGDTKDWILRIVAPENRFSMLEDLFMDFRYTLAGKLVRVTHKYSPDIGPVHTFVTSPSNRDVAADILAKHSIPAFFNASISYEVDAANVTTTAVTMLSAIEDYVNSLGIGNSLEISDLVDLMYDEGAVKVTLPIDAEIEIHNTDTSVQIAPSEDELVVPDNITDDPNSRPLSARITHILPGTITLSQATA